MNKNLRFSHKILLAASLIVIAAFALFTLYNDYLQRNAIRDDLDNYLQEMGNVTAKNIQTWLAGRALLVENLSQSVALNPDPANVSDLLEQKAVTSTFMGAYLGNKDGSFIIRPDSKMPDGYDPRAPLVQECRKHQWFGPDRTLCRPRLRATGDFHRRQRDQERPAHRRGRRRPEPAGDRRQHQRPDFDGMGYAFLISADGKVLVHPDKNLVMKNLKDIYPQDTPKISGDLSEVSVDGKTRIVTFTQIKGLSSVNWYIGLSVDKDKAFSMLKEFRTSAVIATLTAVA